MDIFSIFTMMGGLAFFLYGMIVMSSGLERIAGGKMEKLLEQLTSNPIKGLLLGAGMTIAIQSSSAVTVMLVGFVNSGMMLRDAWKKICENKEGVLYDEMRLTTDELNNGVTEINCYFNFAERCGLKQMRKFASLVTQSLAKGGSDLSVFLRDMSDEMWAEKQADVRVRAEKAGARLMIPTVMIFLGIMMLVIVPALAGM